MSHSSDPSYDNLDGWWQRKYDTLEAERDALAVRIKVLEDALRYYANPNTYAIEHGTLIMDDMGNVGDGTFDLGATARAVLAGMKP
jgi:hypothetical protein